MDNMTKEVLAITLTSQCCNKQQVNIRKYALYNKYTVKPIKTYVKLFQIIIYNRLVNKSRKCLPDIFTCTSLPSLWVLLLAYILLYISITQLVD